MNQINNEISKKNWFSTNIDEITQYLITFSLVIFTAGDKLNDRANKTI